MSLRKELRQLINPRADCLARGKANPAKPMRIILRLVLMLVLVGLSAALLTHLFAAI